MYSKNYCVNNYEFTGINSNPHSLLPTPYSLLPIPYSLLPTPYSLLQATIFISVQVLIVVVVENQLADQKHQDCGFDNRLYPAL